MRLRKSYARRTSRSIRKHSRKSANRCKSSRRCKSLKGGAEPKSKRARTETTLQSTPDAIPRILDYLTSASLRNFRAVDTHSRDEVRQLVYNNFNKPFPGRVAVLRRMYAKIESINLRGRSDLTIADFQHLQGVKHVNLTRANIPSGALRYLRDAETIILARATGTFTDNEFHDLKSVKQLDISNQHRITNHGISLLPPSLTNLTIESCDQADLTDDAFVYLKNLRVLRIRSCPQFTAKILKLVPNLSILEIKACNGIDESMNPSDFSHFKTLVSLTLSAMLHLTDEMLLNFTNLTYLDISLTVVSGRGLQNIKALYELVADDALEFDSDGFQYLSKLRKLSLYNKFAVRPLLPSEAFKYLTQLEELRISIRDDITADHFKYIPQLRVLSVKEAPNLTDDYFKYFENLHTLSLSYLRVTELTSAAFAHLRNLKNLAVPLSAAITDDYFSHFRDGQLELVDIRYATKLTDATFQKFTNVRELNMEGCTKITDAAFANLGKVEILDISYCSQLSAAILPYMPRLRSLTINYYQNRSINYDAIARLKNLEDIQFFGSLYLDNADMRALQARIQ